MKRAEVEQSGIQRSRATRLEQGLAWLLGTVLLALHLDLWRERGTGLVGGVLPRELVDRLVWMVLAWLYLVWFSVRIWRGEDEAA